MTRILTTLGLALWTTLQVHAQIADPVDWTYSYELTGGQEAELIFSAEIDSPWHLYSAYLPEGGPIPTQVLFEESGDFSTVGQLEEVTKPKVKFDEGFQMELGTLSGNARLRQKVILKGPGPVTISGEIQYQVCDDVTCLPPKYEPFSMEITLPGSGAEQEAGAAESPGAVERTGDEEGPGVEEGSGEEESPGAEQPAEEEAGDGERSPSLQGMIGEETGTGEQESVPGEMETFTGEGTDESGERIASVPVTGQEGSLWGFFWLAFGLGLLALLTPCVFPMIPMTVSFFMQGSDRRARAILRAMIFGLSIVAIYTALGVIVSLTNVGPNAANALSTHWIPNVIFFALFVFFAFAFFGMYELVLPSRWVNKADSRADRGGMGGAFFLALTTVLVSFSCTGPIVGALLVEAAGGLALEPVLGMFGFALAFAIPFTLFAMFPSWLKGLPKSGGWLNSVKVVLGFIVLAFSMKFLLALDPTSKVLTRELYLAVWIVLFFLLGLYFLGKIRFAHDTEVKHVTVPRLLLSLVTFTFVIYLFMGLFGYELKNVASLLPPKSESMIDLTRPAAVSAPAAAEPEIEACVPEKHVDKFRMPYNLTSFYDLEEGLACASATGKPVLIDFKGHFCSNCKKMEAAVWSDPQVLNMLRNDFVIVTLYLDDRTRLPESEWYTSPLDGRVKKTIGQQNVDYEIRNFQTNTMPLYVIMDPEGNVVVPPKGTDLN
ncbi:MAG: cytochrome c biogenesis protein CcdA, partial [Bacteroidota bacterium]